MLKEMDYCMVISLGLDRTKTLFHLFNEKNTNLRQNMTVSFVSLITLFATNQTIQRIKNQPDTVAQKPYICI